MSISAQLTRRTFAAAAAAPLLPIPVWAAKPYGRDSLSVVTDEMGKTEAEALAFAKQYRLTWIELRRVPEERRSYHVLPEPELRERRKRMDDAGLKVSFLNTPFFKSGLPGTEPVFAKPEPEDRKAQRLVRQQREFDSRSADIESACRAAQILGVPMIRIFGFLRIAEPMSVLPRIAEIFGELSRIAEREGIQLLVENEASCNVATCAELAAVVKGLPEKTIGINWDADNGNSRGEKPFPDGYAMLPKKRIRNVQMKGRSLLDFPQRLDWTAILAAMAKDGYRGKFGLETHIFGDRLIEYSHESIREMLRLVGEAS